MSSGAALPSLAVVVHPDAPNASSLAAACSSQRSTSSVAAAEVRSGRYSRSPEDDSTSIGNLLAFAYPAAQSSPRSASAEAS